MTGADALAIEPIGHALDAVVRPPGSKSFTNRALVCAAMAEGVSTLRGALMADDTEAMIGCLRTLGAVIDVDAGAKELRVQGAARALRPGPATLDARMSGTTARFVLALLALGSGDYRVEGHPSLAVRPMGPALDALRQLGVDVSEHGEPGRLPVTVHARGSMNTRNVRLSGDVSSQFLSGLLLAAPCTPDGLRIELTSELVSRPYVIVTESCMTAFGAQLSVDDAHYDVAPLGYRAADYGVEPDASAASYLFAAAALCGGRVRVDGLGLRTVQGDLQMVEVLSRMGAEVEIAAGYTEVRGTGELHGVEVDMADISDTAPTIAVVAACASSPTRVTGVGFIRRKETDRVAAIVHELRRCGVDADEEDDGFVVRPPVGGPHGGRIETYDDHRMAMSFGVLGLRVPGISIVDPACVAKTFPDFFEVIETLRVASGSR